MSPWMNSDTRPDPAREGCGNCHGTPWEDHLTRTCRCGRTHRLCPDVFDGGEYDLCSPENHYRSESDEDRIADRAGSMGL